jgi:hypothetical protein
MALPDVTTVLSLDYSMDGSPWCKVVAKAGITPTSLDYSMDGSPWVGTEYSAGTAYYQTLDAATSATAALVRKTLIPLNPIFNSPTGMITPVFVRKTAHHSSATTALTSTVARKTSHHLDISTMFSASFSRNAKMIRAVMTIMASSMTRATTRSLSVTPKLTATMAKLTKRTLSTASSFGASLSRSTQKVLALTVGFTGTMARLTKKVLAETIAFGTVLVSVFHPAGGGALYFQTLDAVADLGASISRTTRHTLSVAVGWIASLTRIFRPRSSQLDVRYKIETLTAEARLVERDVRVQQDIFDVTVRIS